MEKIQVMRTLGDWIESYNWRVYFNQKNPDGFPIFHGNTNSKPDMLLRKNEYNVLVEAKSGGEHKNILDGIDQVLKYCGEYYSGRTNYFVDGEDKKLEIDAIVLATEYSMDGYLYINEANVNYLDTSYLAKKKNMTEKPITHSLIRFLWRQWESGYGFRFFRNIRRGKAGKDTTLPPNKPKVGAIVSKTNKDTRQTTNQPYLFMNSNEFVPLGCKKIYCFEG